ncbi:peptide deformylase [Flavobacterium sp. xlx-214]|uniref:peptide deformylase n=1 Tax=unclassified Flavobacterium TaxID=196869 RepID=UPI0013D2FC4A|nr:MULTISPECIES: peptide deformylase [unclassified Flavobacterium]MBA5793729.1 peptide deformylase [Flavobacterium sp. xlx-221]QMI83250.1 peptide deformylase [Flavobacterium sp. xlx-214]
MILSIVGYGDPVLRKKCEEITPEYPQLQELISNMYETMDHAYGVGLAAPQIGLPIRLFVVSTKPFSEDEDLSKEEQEFLANFSSTFINAKILNEEGKEWAFNEGCLSIPGVREDVYRKPNITIEYYDENFTKHTKDFSGYAARVIQHEYDHIEGILFTDKISTLKKKLNTKRLNNIMEGKVFPDYKMKFINKKGR